MNPWYLHDKALYFANPCLEFAISRLKNKIEKGQA